MLVDSLVSTSGKSTKSITAWTAPPAGWRGSAAFVVPSFSPVWGAE
jgi:hypothetical protein